MAEKLDLENISLEDLVDIHNQVLQRVAVATKLNIDGGVLAAGHDSHGSNHSNNKITDRVGLQQQLARVARTQG